MQKALLFAAAVMAAAPTPALAAVTVYRADLTGAQEVPPVATPATGVSIVTVDDVLNTLRIQVTFSGLLGVTSSAHIHCCASPGVNAGIVTPQPAFLGFPLGVQAGGYDETFGLLAAETYAASFVNANGGTPAGARARLLSGLSGGLAYVNVHSNRFPGGEIRGQLAAVPEPSTWLFMLAGFGLAGWSLRRRPVAIAQTA